MWAMGCIVAEMFTGKPLLPGSSTIDQLDKILEMCGKPSAAAITQMNSQFAGEMIKTRAGTMALPDASRGHRLAKVKEMMEKEMRGKEPCDAAVIELVCDLLDIDPT